MSAPSSRWTRRAALILLLVTRFALGLSYSLVVPIWEAYDEVGHFAYLRYLVRYRHLLEPDDPEAQKVWERFQPPLYYLLIAPAVAWLDLGEAPPEPRLNPYFVSGDAGVNYALHPAALQGTDLQVAWAVHVGRAMGVLLTTLSVLFVYHAARRMWPRQPSAAWAATCLYAFWPQLLFNGSMLTNDLLVTALSAGVFYVCVLLVLEGIRARRIAALAALMAAAMLTKINALALLPMAALAVGLSLRPLLRRTERHTPRLWLALFALAGSLAAVGGILSSLHFLTNQVLQATTLFRFLANAPAFVRLGSEGSGTLALALRYGFRTYFASFGWGNLETFPWAYPLWDVGAGLAVTGLALRAIGGSWRKVGDPGARLLLLMSLQVLGFLSLTLALVIASGDVNLLPGRYLLPTLPAAACLLVEGWRVLAGRARSSVLRGLSLGLLLLAWLIPIQTLAPAYARPLPMDRPPEIAAAYDLGEAIQLVGYDRPAAVRPGQTAQVRLCWQATRPVSQDYGVFLEAVGPDGQGYGRLVSYPGRGNFPTSEWVVGQPFCDRYDLPVAPEMPAPAQAEIKVALLTTTEVNGPRLPVTDGDGQRADGDAIPVPLKMKPPLTPAGVDKPVGYRFGDELRLQGYTLTAAPQERSVHVTLRWQALRDLSRDYVVFVHLRDTPQTAFAQGDSQPRSGWYPTHLWQKGEIVLDEHVLPLPAGTAPPLALYVGVVDPATDRRLAATDAAGQRVPDDEVILERDYHVPAAGVLLFLADAFTR